MEPERRPHLQHPRQSRRPEAWRTETVRAPDEIRVPASPPLAQLLRRGWRPAWAVGLGIVALCGFWQSLDPAARNTILQALIAGSIAAGATALGTLPALATRSISARARDMLLGFGAGVMLAASSFSL